MCFPGWIRSCASTAILIRGSPRRSWADRIHRRSHLRRVFHRRRAGLAKSKLLACALAPFLWITLEFFRTNIPIIGSSVGSVRLSRRAQHGAAANDIRHRNLRAVFLDCRLRIAARLRRARGFAPRVAHGRDRNHRIDPRRCDWPALIPNATPHYVAHLVQTNFPQSEVIRPIGCSCMPANWTSSNTSAWTPRSTSRASSSGPKFPLLSSFKSSLLPRAPCASREIPETIFWSAWWIGNEIRTGKWLASNSAVLLDPAGQRIFTYDKIHLLPFGEYVPLRGWLTFARRLTADISDFTPGSAYSVGAAAGGKFGVFICYEAIFPSEVRQFTAQRRATAGQHFQRRLVRPLRRPDAALDDGARPRRGESPLAPARHQQRLYRFHRSLRPHCRRNSPLDIRGELDAPYDFRSDLTPYARFGDWFSWLCVIVTFALLAISFRKSPINVTPRTFLGVRELAPACFKGEACLACLSYRLRLASSQQLRLPSF